MFRSIAGMTALSVLPLAAQFTSLSTNNDGSLLFFTTPLSQTGVGQPNFGKVFVVDSTGVRPWLLRTRLVDGNATGNAYTTNAYNLVGVSAGDNSNVAVSSVIGCVGFSVTLCGSINRTDVYNANRESVFSGEGTTVLSRNGNWALVRKMPADLIPQIVIVDLARGQQYTTASLRTLNAVQSIADDGTAIVWRSAGLVILRPAAGTQTLSSSIFLTSETLVADSAVIDARATSVVWRDAAGIQLSPVTTPFSPIILDRNGTDPRISADGTVVLFRAKPQGEDDVQLFVIRADGSARRQVTDEPEGIQSAVLSGDGSISWAVTNRGRLLRVELRTGLVREFTGRVPAALPASFSPDSKFGAVAAQGQPFTIAASVTSTDAIEARLDGFKIPVLAIGDGQLTLQMPWDADSTRVHGLSLSGAAANPWEGASLAVFAPKYQPSFLRSADGFAVAATEKFDAVISDARPAHAGDIIHLFGTGFGPVTPAVATGSPASSVTLSRTDSPMSCVMHPNTNLDPAVAVTVLFAGLAPGTIGYYQVDLLLPKSLLAALYELSCQVSTSGLFAALLPVQ